MNFGKLLEEVYLNCGLLALRRAATGGSATTVVDTGIINRKGDGYYAQGNNGGHVLFVSQSTDRAAPEAEFGVVSSFTLSASTPTFTIPTVSAAVAAGDIYSVMKPTIPLYEMIARVNEGMRRLPPVQLSDVSLTGAANTLEYSLPVATKGYEIQEVRIGNATDGYQKKTDYRIRPAAAGSVEKLVFLTQPDDDTIEVTYLGKQTALSLYSDSISEKYPEELVIAVCSQAAWEMLMRKRPSWYVDKTKMGMYNDIIQRAERAKAENPVRTLPAGRTRTHELGRM